MATLQSSSIMSSSNSLSSGCRRGIIRGAISIPSLPTSPLSLPNLSARGLVEELELRNGYTTKIATTHIERQSKSSDSSVIKKLYAIMEAVADRIEMHKNIGEQRDNWNTLLLNSINMITLTAATMAGIASTATNLGAPIVALKLSSTLLYLSTTGLLFIMNKIQPSQLVEEQRNASRLFRQLHTQIQTTISIGNVTTGDVREAMERVLALDRAYPLPLLGSMLDKFPEKVEPAVWWPQQKGRIGKRVGRKIDRNGWDLKLEEEMREIVGVLERKDKEDYLRLGEKALRLNKILAISGPLLTGLGALGSAFVGSPSIGSWAAVLGVVGGAMASVVNTIEHGGQVGMVVEMYRSNAGFFRLVGETIESNLKERDVERRENGELLEMKVAFQLGRSLSELRNLAASSLSSSRKGQESEEFASKLF